jgi:hypothetical protein
MLFSVQGWLRIRYFEAFTPAVATALGIAAASLTRARSALVAPLLAALFAWPLLTSLDIARSGRYDSQTLGALPATWVRRLSPFVRTGRLAVSSAVLAGPLIVHDGRPVTILTSWKGRPFTTARQLQDKVTRGEVR